MDVASYEQYLEDIRLGLIGDDQVQGLIAIGSTADPDNRDAWSDHGFWVITDPGAVSRYLDSVTWLPRSDQILLTSRHGPASRTVLYNNRHKVDYSVLDMAGLASGTLERYKVILDRGQVLSAAESGLERTRKERIDILRHSFTLQGFGILVWTAYGRAARGELLSARLFVELSADVLLNLLCVHTSLGRVPTIDTLDPRRRLERNRPKLAYELLEIITSEAATACPQLLALADRELRERTPELNWDEIDQLRSWMVSFQTGG